MSQSNQVNLYLQAGMDVVMDNTVLQSIFRGEKEVIYLFI